MGEIHFVDNDRYDVQSLDFGQASIVNYSRPQVESKNNFQLIECKEACIELDYLNSCCNVECIAYNEDLEELGKFEFHTDRQD